MVRVLIDGDVLLVKSLFAVGGDKYYEGLRAVDFTIDNILSRLNSKDFMIGIGGEGNFRKLISPTYKSNRDPSKMPKYLFDAKQYLIKYYGAVEAHGMETDDLLAIEHDSCSTVLVSNDHDFKQLGGKIYNHWGKDGLVEITNPDYWWWLQMLTGCKTDMVEGLTNPAKLHHAKPPKFTEDTAHEVLKDKSSDEMKETVIDLYKQIHGEGWFEKFDVAGRLLFLRRKDATEYYQRYC